MWFQQIIRTFFFSLDSTLFNFIPTIYDLLITISRTTILTQGQIKQFADRIQMLLGVFMLFKVSFSLITYIINPDDFSDKSKGFGKLWMNIIISLIMLVIVPYIFSMAYQLQGMLLEENTLATLILGETEESSNANYINTAGQKMAYTIMLPFFLPNSSYDELNSCVNLVDIDGKTNDECFNSMQKVLTNNENVPNYTVENYKQGIKNSSLGLTFRLDIAKVAITLPDGNDMFLIDYKAPLSTVVAVVVILLLVTFCMDVAVRSIKLSFLQLVYPIPVISFIDPKSGKDGLFKKWYEMCFKTYISLFVRLIALYFGIYIISRVTGMTDIVNGSRVDDFWVKIFIIIGVLMFIKQLPKILEGLGIKLDGDGKFRLNPFKKLEDEAVGGKQIVGAGKGLATGLAAGAVGFVTGAGPGRILTGAFGGMKSGIQGKKFNDIRMDQVKRNADMRKAKAEGSTFGGRVGAAFSSYIGASGKLGSVLEEKEKLSFEIKGYENKIKQQQDLKKSFEQSMAPTKREISNYKAFADAVKAMEERAKSEIEAGHGGSIGIKYTAMKAKYESLKNKGASAIYTDVNGNKFFGEGAIAAAERDMNDYLNKVGLQQYLSEASTKTGNFAIDPVTHKQINSDATFDNLRLRAEQLGTKALPAGVSLATDGATIHSQMGEARGKISSRERSIYAVEQNIAKVDDEITKLTSEQAKLGDKQRELDDKERVAKADMDAVHGQHPGPRGPGGPGGPRPPFLGS